MSLFSDATSWIESQAEELKRKAQQAITPIANEAKGVFSDATNWIQSHTQAPIKTVADSSKGIFNDAQSWIQSHATIPAQTAINIGSKVAPYVTDFQKNVAQPIVQNAITRPVAKYVGYVAGKDTVTPSPQLSPLLGSTPIDTGLSTELRAARTIRDNPKLVQQIGNESGSQVHDYFPIHEMFQNLLAVPALRAKFGTSDISKADLSAYAPMSKEELAKYLNEKQKSAFNEVIALSQGGDVKPPKYKVLNADNPGPTNSMFSNVETGNELPKEPLSFQQYQDAQKSLEQEAKQYEVKSPGFFQKIKQSLTPLKYEDPEVQAAYTARSRAVIAGREMANQEAQTLSNIPKDEGLDTILNYEKGVSTPYTQDISNAFDNLYQEANARGIEVPYHENYLPQKYNNTFAEIKTATSKYLADQGVADNVIQDYLDGGTLPVNMAERLRLNPSFSMQRVLPDYATGLEYGLTPKYTNPAQLLGDYRDSLERAIANRDFLDSLVSNGKLSPEPLPGWRAVETSFSPKGYYAEPRLADLLNKKFGDPTESAAGTFWSGFSKVSKTMQQFALSGGPPNTDINTYSVGQKNKYLTAGNFKAAQNFIRANSNDASIAFFEDKAPYLKMMSEEGIDLSNRVGNFKSAYDNVLESKSFRDMAGETMNKAFEEKTFNSLIPQNYVSTFESAYNKFIDSGYDAPEAQKMAADVVRNFYGITEDMARSKGTENVISSVFFAPKFREGLWNTMLNTIKSVSTEASNPTFYMNRRLVAGMATTYLAYNLLNKKLTGHYMFENPSGHEFQLMVEDKKGNATWIPWMPSSIALFKNLISGGIALATGNLETAGQKFGSTFSTPISLGTEAVFNRDYFGNPLYQPTDTGLQKYSKLAGNTALNAAHPWIQAGIKFAQGKLNLQQALAKAFELPVSFSSKEQLDTAQYYDAKDKRTMDNAAAKRAFQPTYNKIKALIDAGKYDQALAITQSLSPQEYALYKTMKTADKTKSTNQNKASFYATFLKIKDLIKQGSISEAQAMVSQLSPEDYKSYKSLKATFGLK